jgi:hypothetical protein
MCIVIPLTVIILFTIAYFVQPINSMIYLKDIRVGELTKYKIDNKNEL